MLSVQQPAAHVFAKRLMLAGVVALPGESASAAVEGAASEVEWTILTWVGLQPIEACLEACERGTRRCDQNTPNLQAMTRALRWAIRPHCVVKSCQKASQQRVRSSINAWAVASLRLWLRWSRICQTRQRLPSPGVPKITLYRC